MPNIRLLPNRVFEQQCMSRQFTNPARPVLSRWRWRIAFSPPEPLLLYSRPLPEVQVVHATTSGWLFDSLRRRTFSGRRRALLDGYCRRTLLEGHFHHHHQHCHHLLSLNLSLKSSKVKRATFYVFEAMIKVDNFFVFQVKIQ